MINIDCKNKDINEISLLVYKELLECEVGKAIDIEFIDKVIRFVRVK